MKTQIVFPHQLDQASTEARGQVLDQLAIHTLEPKFLVPNCARQDQSVHFSRTTVMLTLINQAEIWFVASHAQNLISNEISAHSDKQFLSYDNFSSNFWHLEDFLKKVCFSTHIWQYLRNHCSDWTEIFCENRVWSQVATHQITAFKVEGCRRYWVVRLECTDWHLRAQHSTLYSDHDFRNSLFQKVVKG